MWRLIGEACLLITRSTLTVRRNILDRFDKNIQVSIDDKKVFNACSKNCREKKKRRNEIYREFYFTRGMLGQCLEEAMFYTNSLIRWDTEIKGDDGEGRGDGVW